MQRLCQNSHKSDVRLPLQAVCRLEAYSKLSLFIEFTGLPVAAALLWTQDVIGAVVDDDGGSGGLQLLVHHPTLVDNGIVEFLQKMSGLIEVLVEPVERSFLAVADSTLQLAR